MIGETSRIGRWGGIAGLPVAAMLVCGLAGIAVAAPKGMPPAEEKDMEQRIGQADAASLLQEQILLYAPALQQRCQEIAEKLLRAAGSDAPVHIYILNTPLATAYTVASGDIFLCAGLLDQIQNEDELAAALGHEISHYVNHDALEGFKRAVAAAKNAGTAAQFAVQIGASLLSAVVGDVVGSALAPPPPGLYDDPAAYAARNIAQLWGSTAAEVATGMLASQAIANTAAGIVMGASSTYPGEVEARADSQGIEFAQEAGFDPALGKKLRERLDALKRQASQAAAHP